MQYDAAIIGAGPAGATFARRLAQQSPELKILLLDAQDEGHKKPCGGLLAPDAQKTLAHFDLVLPKSVLADPQIFAVETMDLRTRRVRYYQRYYLNMDRYAFDRWLVSLVPPTVEIVRGRCTAVSRTDGGFVLTVRTAEGAPERAEGEFPRARGLCWLSRRRFRYYGVWRKSPSCAAASRIFPTCECARSAPENAH